ncbi:hypothetical protein AB0D27_09345 [Streptomyces sp. NPDC048415]|uniref:hypothetical protein n=1 Tax=Streptomyces sp. NPDC048415 TaxID=3154822 RepID=UPI0034287E50
MSGLEYAVQETAYQGAALGAGVGLDGGALVDVRLGDGAHDSVMRLQEEQHERLGGC